MKTSTTILWLTALVLAIPIALGIVGRLDSQTVLGIVGAISALAFFLMQNALETARFRRELFVQFNQTYSQLNDKLDDVLRRAKDEPLGEADKKTLQDYFNLCGEEYYYYRKGYVDEEVWRNWLRGMSWWYAADERIAKYWNEELAQESYYRLSAAIIRDGQKQFRSADRGRVNTPANAATGGSHHEKR